MINKVHISNKKKLIIFFSGACPKNFHIIFKTKTFNKNFDIIEIIYNLQNTTFKNIITKINNELKPFLLNYKEKIAICKSFGGIISILTKINFDKYIFLASPIIINKSSIKEIYNTNLDNLKLEDVNFDTKDFKNKNIFIFQGIYDNPKFIKYSKKLAKTNNYPIFFFNTNHSFDNAKLEKKVLEII